MARNVALSDKAYRDLEKLKRSNESFSDVILRLIGKESKDDSWKKSFGALAGDKEMERIYKKILADRHKGKARGVRL